jgi:hypothetical protein
MIGRVAVLIAALIASGCGYLPPSAAAKGIAEAFEKGELTKIDVSPMSISELATTYMGHQIVISWYPGPPRHIRTLVVDGSEGVFPSSNDSYYIFNAALDRADRILDDKMAELNREAAKPH